jgi:hypothetical protein
VRADNTQHLRDAVARRHHEARERAVTALEQLQHQNVAISVAGLSRAAGVARSWIYSQPDLLADITRLRGQPVTTIPTRTRASDDSWKHRLELAHARIRDLTTENQTLRDQLARTHGQLRAHRTTTGTTRTGDSPQR